MSRAAARTIGTKKSLRTKVHRFDARLNEDQKTLRQRAMPILSARETEAFVDAILTPSKPGRVLRAGAQHYKDTIGR